MRLLDAARLTRRGRGAWEGHAPLSFGNAVGGNSLRHPAPVILRPHVSRRIYIYHAVTAGQYFRLVLSLLMSAVLPLSAMRRETHGIGNIGFESTLVLVFDLGGTLLMMNA